MKKIIVKCVIFILILFIILLVLSKIFIPKNNTKKAGIPRTKYRQTGVLAEPENTLDVLIIGDSEAYTSFIPLEAWNKYGFTSYVCGAPAQKLPAVMALLNQTLDRQKPKIIMLEANTIYKRASLTAPFVRMANNVLPVVQYHNRWKSLNKEDFFGKVEYKKIEPNKGYYMSDKVKPPKKEKEYMRKSKKEEKIPIANKFYVKKIKQKCDSINAEFILYSTPAPANWNRKKHNGIASLAKEMGVEYLDMNLKQKELNMDWKKDTRDKGDHLNYTGSLKTTKFLGEYLDKKNLPDHRQDETYKSWNKYYKKYIKRVNEKDSSRQNYNT